MSEIKTGSPVASLDGSPFRRHQPFPPAGDQPEAIRLLVEGLADGLSYQILLGVTGSSKWGRVQVAMLREMASITFEDVVQEAAGIPRALPSFV